MFGKPGHLLLESGDGHREGPERVGAGDVVRQDAVVHQDGDAGGGMAAFDEVDETGMPGCLNQQRSGGLFQFHDATSVFTGAMEVWAGFLLDAPANPLR